MAPQSRSWRSPCAGDIVDGVQAPDRHSRSGRSFNRSPDTSGLPGYRIEIGGAIEESAKANASIFAAVSADDGR